MVLEIITIVISVISLIAVIYQGIILKITIGNQIYDSFIGGSVELDKILIERPYLRKYVYDNAPVSEDTENIDEIMSTIELIVDLTENIGVYKKYIPKSRADGWLKFVQDTRETNAYKFFMSKYGEWFEVK